MWYFSWMLGVGLAMAFGIINVMWLEAEYFCKIEPEEKVPGEPEHSSLVRKRTEIPRVDA
jgi:cyd operon protein YbgT